MNCDNTSYSENIPLVHLPWKVHDLSHSCITCCQNIDLFTFHGRCMTFPCLCHMLPEHQLVHLPWKVCDFSHTCVTCCQRTLTCSPSMEGEQVGCFLNKMYCHNS